MKQRLLSLLLLISTLTAAGCATAPASPRSMTPQALPDVPMDPAALLPLDPAINTGNLDNGLTY